MIILKTLVIDAIFLFFGIDIINCSQVFDGAADRYILDENMAEKLKLNNPEAFRNIIKRMLEAKGRGFWEPSDDVITKLQELFEEVEDEIEGV